MLERIAFLVEETGQRISALLNPETIRMRRQSGLRTLDDRPGTITGAGGSDDLVIATSGGRTEMELDLLFDVELLPANPDELAIVDVRSLTGPLWSLTENGSRSAGPTPCRVVWGKHLNVNVLVESVSERLERFDPSGIPRRSYLSLRLLRTTEPEPTTAPAVAAPPPPISTAEATPRAPFIDAPDSTFHEVLGSPGGGERLDQLAARYYGNPEYWRHLAAVNTVENPPWVSPGRILVIPSLAMLSVVAPPDPGSRSGPGSGTSADPAGSSVDAALTVATQAAVKVLEAAR